MNKIIIALAVVLAILIGLLAFFMIREKKAANESTEISTVQTETHTEATEPSEQTEEPTQTDAPETKATEKTEQTEPTQAPTEPTEATEEPTETAAPIDGEKTNSGQFTSSTGTGLELIVDWTTYSSSDGTKMVRFDVSISSFSINVGSRIDGIHITLGGVTKSFDSADVTWSGSKTTHLLASCTMEMSGDSASVDVAWDFRGTYSGTPLEQVTASGTVTR
ncbi:MAG: hypothetical protein IJJ99_06035 [Oscillospiraceae bacterium]|nr:hypothetical protein [Oscillospiraceae bacterium]